MTIKARLLEEMKKMMEDEEVSRCVADGIVSPMLRTATARGSDVGDAVRGFVHQAKCAFCVVVALLLLNLCITHSLLKGFRSSPLDEVKKAFL